MFGGKKNSTQKESYDANVKKAKEVVESKKTDKIAYGFKKLVDRAKIPTKKDDDAGYDLSVTYVEAVEKHNGRIKKLPTNSNGCFEVFPNIVYRAHTGIAANLPKDNFGLIKPRSSMSAEFGLDTLAGVCDPSYVGEVIVVFTVVMPTEIEIGQRIAQMVVLPYVSGLGEVEELKDTERGSKGFGSSGK